MSGLSVTSPRRVVTGLDAPGQSCVGIDGEVPLFAETGLALVLQAHAVGAGRTI